MRALRSARGAERGVARADVTAIARDVQGVWGPLAALRGLLARPLASYYLLLSSTALLVAIGLVMVFSATSVQALEDGGSAFGPVAQQTTWAGIGLAVFWLAQRLPLRSYQSIGSPLLLISVAMLVFLAVVPDEDMGPVVTEKGIWLQIGGLNLQPSEVAKVAFVLWGAQVLVRKGRRVANFWELALPLFPVAGLLFLLVGWADLGTMVCLLVIFLALLYVVGVRFRVFAGIVVVGLVAVALLILPSEYRLDRLDAFRDPSSVALEAGYQPLQGLYAIATGGWFGVGLGESRQAWMYLPEPHNDFIFAILAEELGVIGSVVVLTLLALFAYSGLRIARRVSDPYARVVAASSTIWLVGQAMINICTVVGLLPVTGLPLPFISAGGSALVVAMAVVGMLASWARAEPAAARVLHARPPRRWVQILWAPLPPLPRTRTRAPRPGGRSKAGRGSGRGGAPR